MQKVYIVEDHPVTRVGITQLLSRENDFEVCGQTGNYGKVLNEIKKSKPHIALLGMSIRCGSEIDLIKDIKKENSEILILIFSTLDERFYAERVIAAGANGFLMKHESSEKLVEALRSVLLEKLYLSDQMKNILIKKLAGMKSDYQYSLYENLSNREIQIFKLLGEGYKPGEIAVKIDLSIKTIDTYLQRIKVKLKTHTASELTRKAIKFNRRIN